MCVGVGVGVGACVHACVCVCLNFFTAKASSVCDDAWDILEGTDQLPCAVSIVKFLHLRF